MRSRRDPLVLATESLRVGCGQVGLRSNAHTDMDTGECQPAAHRHSTPRDMDNVEPSSKPPSTATITIVIIVLVSLVFVDTDASPLTTKDRVKDTCNKTIEIFQEVNTPQVTSENRGRPLLCYYHFRIAPQKQDWIITVRFHKFKVGRLLNESACVGGHVQIQDGPKNSTSPGYFCGEVDRPRVYISETNHVVIMFYAASFSEGTYIQFDSRAEQKFELFDRYGRNPQLYSDRRGVLVPGTVCDRHFHDCRLGTCYVQSPSYPGVYPRNLRCRYHVTSSTGYVKLYIENEEINIDGQRCEDVILCPNRPVMTQCPYDYISVFDGPTEQSPLIGSFCGRGKLPYAITGSGQHLLLVFVSSPAGPFLNTGFHFNVGPFTKWVGHGATKMNRSCDAVFRRESETPADERRFHSLSTWYEPRTTCSFTVWAWENEIIRLNFRKFKIQRPDSAILDDRGCVETLTIYDAPYADESRIVAMFCDSWSPPLPASQGFISSGNAMFVQFRSEVGSYAGSSLDYWVQFEFFNAFTHGIPVPNTECDELFSSSNSPHGRFSSPLNSLLFTRKTRLQCAYSFQANSVPYERVLLTLISVNFSGSSQHACSNCLHDPVDKIVIHDAAQQQKIECICGAKVRWSWSANPIRVLSTGSSLDVRLFVERQYAEPHLHNTFNSLLFQGNYEFLHGPQCGPAVLEAQHQGELTYPHNYIDGNVEYESRSVHCVWSLLVHPTKSIFLRFESLRLSADCGNDRIEIKIPSKQHEYVDSSFLVICGGMTSPEDLPVITSAMLSAGRALIEFNSIITSPSTSFRLLWTEFVYMEEENVAQTGELRVSGCSFVCGGSNACIPHELVCNGVRNCPYSSSSSSDEDVQLCHADKDPINWLAIGLGASGGGVFATCFILMVHRCCRKYQDTDPG